MAANNIALMPLQRESGVDNYLSSYAQAQQMQQQRMAGERAQAQEQRQQSEFTDQQKMQAIDRLGAALDGIPDGDAAGFERVKAFAVQNGLLDPNEAAKYNVSQLPQIRAMSQQARTMMAQRQKAEMDQQEFGLKSRLTDAQIAAQRANAAQSYASADAAKANAEFIRGGKGVGPGGVKISPTEAKDLRESGVKLSQLESALDDYQSSLSGTTVMGRLSGPIGVSGLQSKHTNLLLQMKELYQLGVLNGPDYMLMTKMVEDPSSYTAALRGGGGLQEQLDVVRGVLKNARQLLEQRAGAAGLDVLSPDAPAAPATFTRGGAGIFSQSVGGQPQQSQAPASAQSGEITIRRIR